MEIAGWSIVIALFIVGMAGAVFPILPGVLAVYGAFFVYGLFFGWESFDAWFWTIQTFIVAVVFIADYAVSALGVKKFGGSRASIIGSTIGIVIGPFVISVFGLVIGPFVGAVIGELMTGKGIRPSVIAGVGAVAGLFSSIVVKIALQVAMIVLFFVWI